jgi:murein DD-endopeptidase MepM/ murein hydrolase activator NlpD
MLLKLTTTLAVFLVWVPVANAWSWPVQGPILQPFSYDEAHPYAAGQHRGVDIGAKATGDPVVAPEGGIVSFAGFVPTSGESLTIETADGYSVTLTHLGSIGVAEGAAVAEGATVATVGPSGTPEQSVPYVHLGVRLSFDPLGYLDALGLLPPPAPPTTTPVPTPAPKPVRQPVPAHELARGGGLVVKNPAAAQASVVVTPAEPGHAAKPSPKPQPHPVRPAKPVGTDAPHIRRPLVEALVDPLWAGALLAPKPLAHAHAQESEPLVLSLAPGIVAALFALVTALTRSRRATPLPARVIAFREEQPLPHAA